VKISGEQRIAGDRQRVWDALNDPAVLRQCIPGCQSLEQDGPDRFIGVAEIKIGPIGARFNAVVELQDKQPPERYTLVGEGKGGMAGHAKGRAIVVLTQKCAETTLLAYEVEADVGGRLAQLGGPIIEATAKRLAADFFAKLERQLSAMGGQEDAATPASDGGSAVGMPATAATQVQGVPAGFPIGLVLLALAALLAGYGVGAAGAGMFWLILVAIFGVVALAAGWQAGRSAGTRR
jgi:carbon monoxide dehydrogenase subunit G